MPDNPVSNLPPHILAQLGAMLAPFLSPATASPAPASPAVAEAATPPVIPPGSSQPLQRAYALRSVLPSITAYQSPRLPTPSGGSASHPRAAAAVTPRQFISPPASQSQVSQPAFLGFEDTRLANSQRLASAAATIPRRTALALRSARSPYNTGSGTPASGGRRGTRGVSNHPPTLVQATGLDTCTFANIADGSPMIRVICKIYPALEAQASDYVVFLQRRDSFNQALSDHHLLYRLELPLTTSIRSLLSTLTERLASSPFQYTFGADEQIDMLPHEALPLTLLRFSNRARRRPSSHQIHLTEHPVLTDEVTLTNIVNDNMRFISIRSEALTARIPSNGPRPYRIHTCVGLRIWSRFPNDSDRVARQDLEDTSGGETDSGLSDHGLIPTDDEDENEFPDVATMLANRAPQRAANAPLATAGNVLQASARPNMSLLPAAPILPSCIFQPIPRTATLTALEEPLWSQPWVPPPLSRQIDGPLNLTELDSEIFEVAVGALRRIPEFLIRGNSTFDLAQKFLLEIGKAVDQGDFSVILSPTRTFQIDGAESQDRALSYGRGVEREVIHLAWQTFLRSDAQWLMPRAGGYSTIAITSRHASPSRLRSLGVLGALVGLLVVHGMAPTPISPGLIQYALHKCNLNSLHRMFLQEWMPELYTTIDAWISTPHTTQDLSQFGAHFASFHDIQVISLKDRDEAGHQALAAEMLHKAVIGPEPSFHPELNAFFKGLRLNCPPSGFDLSKLCVLIEGGSEALLNMVYGSNIKSYDDLSPHIRFKAAAPAAFIEVNNALQGHDFFSFQQLFEVFMEGSGIPRPSLFEECKPHFSPLVDLGAVDDANFRSRHFTWAATGSPALEVAGEAIVIIQCGPGDTSYAVPSMSEAMMELGTICFKTCIKQVRVPVSYLAKLSRSLRAPDAPDVTLQVAFDHWMLTEILNGIGGHSIL